MSYNTWWREVATYQNEKEPTINIQRGRIDAAISDEYILVGDLSPALTVEEFRTLIAINTDATQTADQTITVPADVKKMFVVNNASSFNLAIQQGTKTVSLLPGDRATFYTTGAADYLKRLFSVSSAPIVMTMRPYFQLADTVSKTIYQRVMTANQTLLSVANGLVAYAAVNTVPDADVDFELRKNGVSIGTMKVVSGSSTGTFTVTSDVSFVAGDRFSIATTTANTIGKDYALTIQLT